MKGILLAGGIGSRLAPLTKDDNKHLLPVYNKRMIEYPIGTLVSAGITDIILITGGNRPGMFLEYLKNGKAFGINRLYYTYQEGNGGIADAMKLAQPFIETNEPCAVILGDNYFEDGIKECLTTWMHNEWGGAGCILKRTDTPWDFGIAEVIDSKIVSIEEKPKTPKSDLAILGCYLFDANVWNILPTIEISNRGELEITDVLRAYMKYDELSYSLYSGFWADCGTFENWSRVSHRIASQQK